MDPIKEAQNWLIEQGDLSEFEYIVVLGLGAGFHIDILAQTYPNNKIIVIENYEEFTNNRKKKSDNIQVILATNANHIWNFQVIQALVLKKFKLIKYFPVTQIATHFYQNVENQLLARDSTGFHKQVDLRPKQKELFLDVKVESKPSVKNNIQSLISIKDIVSYSQIQESNSKEALIWKALGELVK